MPLGHQLLHDICQMAVTPQKARIRRSASESTLTPEKLDQAGIDSDLKKVDKCKLELQAGASSSWIRLTHQKNSIVVCAELAAEPRG